MSVAAVDPMLREAAEHYNAGRSDAPVLAGLGPDVIDLAPGLGDFADSAAAVAALDLVISVDTSVAHLAGAMGRPAWILLPYAQDWRWLRDREDSPSSLRLFRQEKPQAWDGALTRVAAELGRLAEARRSEREEPLGWRIADQENRHPLRYETRSAGCTSLTRPASGRRELSDRPQW